jgi:hypothetical protein
MRRTSTLRGLDAAHALELALLQHAQQLHLHLERDLADLVEEQRAAVGQLEAPGLGLHGAGEGAALVAEQLRLHQVLGDGRAVDLDERLVLAGARAVVDGRGDQLLAGADSPVISTVDGVSATLSMRRRRP